MMGVIRFGKKEKFCSRFIGTFEILKKYGVVAYSLALPLYLSTINLVFYVSK